MNILILIFVILINININNAIDIKHHINLKDVPTLSKIPKCDISKYYNENFIFSRLIFYDKTTQNSKNPKIKERQKVRISETCQLLVAERFRPPQLTGNYDPDSFIALGKKKDGTILVISYFRDTEPTISDWKANLIGYKTSCQLIKNNKCGKIHKGFDIIYKLLKHTMLAFTAKLKAKFKKLQHLVVGYSQGGALATLHALALKTQWKASKPIVRTIGSPRVGDKTFKTIYNKQVPDTKRYVNAVLVCSKQNKLVVQGADIVTMNPPNALGYHHVGAEIKIACSVSCTKCPCKTSIGANLKTMINCHDANSYKAGLFRDGKFKPRSIAKNIRTLPFKPPTD